MHQASRERGWHLRDALRDSGTEAGLNGEHLGKQEGAVVETVLPWGLVVPGRVAGDPELDPYVFPCEHMAVGSDWSHSQPPQDW